MGVTGCCRCDDVAQVLAEPACWARCVGGQVKEVVQIGNQHVLAVAPVRFIVYLVVRRSAGRFRAGALIRGS